MTTRSQIAANSFREGEGSGFHPLPVPAIPGSAGTSLPHAAGVTLIPHKMNKQKKKWPRSNSSLCFCFNSLDLQLGHERRKAQLSLFMFSRTNGKYLCGIWLFAFPAYFSLIYDYSPHSHSERLSPESTNSSQPQSIQP